MSCGPHAVSLLAGILALSLMIGGTLGIVGGLVVVDLRDIDDAGIGTISVLGTAAAGAGLGYLASSKLEVDQGQADFCLLGTPGRRHKRRAPRQAARALERHRGLGPLPARHVDARGRRRPRRRHEGRLGLAVSPMIDWSQRRASFVTVATLVGTGVGLGGGAIITGDSKDPRTVGTAGLVGLWGGMLAGGHRGPGRHRCSGRLHGGGRDVTIMIGT